MTYKGVIIEESLEDKKILKEINITETKIEKVTPEHKTPWIEQWTLHTFEISEESVKDFAHKLSNTLDSEHSWYADFKNHQYHYVIYRDKVFKLDRKNKLDYELARKYGTSIGIPDYQLVNYQGLPLDVLANFLNEANKNTYANETAKKSKPSRFKSEDYHFEKDNLIYHDTYFGSKNFIGEEIVYLDNTPKWGMNYYGFMLDDKISEDDLAVFLRKALMQEYEYKEVIPVRGPKTYQDNLWTYELDTQGDLSNFMGEERILKSGNLIYKLHMHGGFIE